jgi:hypothetical protein
MSDYGKWVQLHAMTTSKDTYSHGAPTLNKVISNAKPPFADKYLEYVSVEGTLHSELRWKIVADRKPSRWTVTIFVVDEHGIIDETYTRWCERDDLPKKIKQVYRQLELNVGGTNDRRHL